MWSRVIIVMISLWLMASPYIITGNEVGQLFVTVHALILLTLTCLSMLAKFEKAAFFVFIQGLFLFFYGRFGFEHPQPPTAQNIIVVGILVMMIVIIPLKDQTPPHAQEKGMLEKNV